MRCARWCGHYRKRCPQALGALVTRRRQLVDGVWSPFGSPRQSLGPIVDTLVRIGNAVPDSVELGYHLCYGDAAHKHFSEPRDTAKMADVARGVAHGFGAVADLGACASAP